MKLRTICVTLGTIAVGSALLFAADTWKSKDPSQWSSEDISKILNDSPWAKHVSASAQQNMGQRGRRMGGMGGGGLGLPGGMGGGGGYPGGGGGYGGRGGGGGYPNGDDQSGSGSGATRSIDATLRWESALPVQLAEKQRHSDDQASTPAPAAGEKAGDKKDEDKPYVLVMVGLQIPRPRDTDPNANNDDRDSRYGGRGGARSAEAMRSQFMQNTRILRKSKSALNPSDVKLDADRGEVSFLFRRDEPIDLDDKEVTFETMVGRMKVQEKFKVKDMVFQGKLAL